MTITRTATDTIGRLWTIHATRSAIGIRWTVYIHRGKYSPGALDLMMPGGVAHGWIEDDSEETVQALLSSTMTILGATAIPSTDEQPTRSTETSPG